MNHRATTPHKRRLIASAAAAAASIAAIGGGTYLVTPSFADDTVGAVGGDAKAADSTPAGGDFNSNPVPGPGGVISTPGGEEGGGSGSGTETPDPEPEPAPAPAPATDPIPAPEPGPGGSNPEPGPGGGGSETGEDPLDVVVSNFLPSFFSAAGDNLKMTFTVTNNGGDPLTGVSFSVPMPDGSTCTWEGDIPAQTSTPITCDYTVNRGDLPKSELTFVGTATVDGLDPVSSDSITIRNIGLEYPVELTMTTPGTTGFSAAGETIPLVYQAHNASDVPVTIDIQCEDESVDECGPVELAPGGYLKAENTYLTTPEDVAAEANLVFPVAAKVTVGEHATEFTVRSLDHVVPFAAVLDVTAVPAGEQGTFFYEGQETTLNVSITNDEDAPVNVAAHVDDGSDYFYKFTVAPGATVTQEFPYTVTKADVEAGAFDRNVLLVGTTQPLPEPASAATLPAASSAGWFQRNLTVHQDLVLPFDAKVTDVSADTFANVGDEITFTYLFSGATDQYSLYGRFYDKGTDIRYWQTLYTGPEALTTTHTHTVTQADIDRGYIEAIPAFQGELVLPGTAPEPTQPGQGQPIEFIGSAHRINLATAGGASGTATGTDAAGATATATGGVAHTGAKALAGIGGGALALTLLGAGAYALSRRRSLAD